MAYDKNIIYDVEIDKAVKAGDYKKAAEYERSRNEKIDAEGLPYEKTYNYISRLSNNNGNSYSSTTKPYDYSQLSTDLRASGAPSYMTSAVNSVRNQNILNDPSLSQYYDDDTNKANIAYAASDPMSLQNIANQIGSYQTQINDLIGNFKNMSYQDYLNSNDYSALETKYLNAGNLAMKDTLGTLAAQTGGIASSYGTMAAQGAYNDYLSRLSDAALSAYDTKRAQELEKISALNTQYGNLSNQYQNQTTNYQTYLQFLEDQNNTRWEQAYNAEQVDWQKQTYNKEFDYNAEQDVLDRQYLYDALAQEATLNGQNLAYDYARLNLDQSKFNTEMAYKNSTGTASRGTDYSSIVNKLIGEGYTAAEAQKYIDQLKQAGYI